MYVLIPGKAEEEAGIGAEATAGDVVPGGQEVSQLATIFKRRMSSCVDGHRAPATEDTEGHRPQAAEEEEEEEAEEASDFFLEQ